MRRAAEVARTRLEVQAAGVDVHGDQPQTVRQHLVLQAPHSASNSSKGTLWQNNCKEADTLSSYTFHIQRDDKRGSGIEKYCSDSLEIWV